MRVKPLDIEVGCPSEWARAVMWPGSCHFSGRLILQQQQVEQRPGEHRRQIPVHSRYLGQWISGVKVLFSLQGAFFYFFFPPKSHWCLCSVSECTHLPPAVCVWISTLLQSQLPLNTNNPLNDKRTLQTWHKWGRNNRLTANRWQFVQREHITQVRWRDSRRAQLQKTVKTTFTQRSLLPHWPQVFFRHFLDWNSFK